MRNRSAHVDPSLRHAGLAAGSRAAARRWFRATFAPMLRLVFPPVCALCGDDLAAPLVDSCLCDDCRCALTASCQAACPRCARPLPSSASNGPAPCPRCLRRPYRFDRTVAVGVYSGLLRDAVLKVKRSHQEPLTLALGRLLADRLRARPDWVDPDLVLPVPMHWTRRLLRGVNGPELLAEAVAGSLSLALDTRLLCCQRRTRKQGTLLPSARRRNVRGAYGVTRRGRLAARHILLVDDVLTTGATLDELARVLLRAGARSVSAAVLARGIGFD